MSTTATGSHRGNSPIPMIVLGALLIGFFIAGSILHIQTSEAFFNGGKTVGIAPNWSVILQPYQLIQGQFSPKMAETVMWGWGIELVFLICVVGFEVAHESVNDASAGMARVFRTGMFLLVVFDGWTDFQYGNIANGVLGQLAFALITAFIVFFFGTVGWEFIARGLKEFRRP